MVHFFGLLHLWLQEDPTAVTGGGEGAAAGVAIAAMVVYFGILVLMIAAMWKIFEKAGEPGWAALIPIYNTIVLLKICSKPLWWIVLFIIPFVNVIAWIMVSIALAERFGKGVGFGIGIAFLPFIFMPLLAWSESRYGAASPQMA
ncbi:MAG TPA: DUF5684 domain-containing protein [Thermoanaerobaculia bacterium]